ncbi:MAG: hypothetical protein CL521_05385, partial [Actinobacteria bacterium]|nr:hypothetical protein [Actinomycetota bacterium]
AEEGVTVPIGVRHINVIFHQWVARSLSKDIAHKYLSRQFEGCEGDLIINIGGHDLMIKRACLYVSGKSGLDLTYDCIQRQVIQDTIALPCCEGDALKAFSRYFRAYIQKGFVSIECEFIGPDGERMCFPESYAILMGAKFISEPARMGSIWGINQMMLDLIDSGQIRTWDQFFDMHPMKGGSWKNGGAATTKALQIETASNQVIMMWLATFLEFRGNCYSEGFREFADLSLQERQDISVRQCLRISNAVLKRLSHHQSYIPFLDTSRVSKYPTMGILLFFDGDGFGFLGQTKRLSFEHSLIETFLYEELIWTIMLNSAHIMGMDLGDIGEMGHPQLGGRHVNLKDLTHYFSGIPKIDKGSVIKITSSKTVSLTADIFEALGVIRAEFSAKLKKEFNQNNSEALRRLVVQLLQLEDKTEMSSWALAFNRQSRSLNASSLLYLRLYSQLYQVQIQLYLIDAQKSKSWNFDTGGIDGACLKPFPTDVQLPAPIPPRGVSQSTQVMSLGWVKIDAKDGKDGDDRFFSLD